MYLKLKWENINAGPVTVKIYRSDTPIDRANLGSSPIATLTAGETEYSDTTVVAGNLYYYVFETTSTTDRVVSPNYTMRAVPRRGPGPTVLQFGDYNYGYYGSLPSSSFINTLELRNQVNFALGTNYNTAPTWHKYARNGKIIYVPEGPVVGAVTWDQLYLAGLTYGVDANGPAQYAFTTPTNQKKQVTIGAEKFWVRLMRGYSDDFAQFPPVSTTAEPLESFTCEWDDFAYPMVTWMPDRQRMPNVANIPPNTLLATLGVWTQERTTALATATDLVRGVGAVNSRTGIANRSVSAGSGSLYWWPVLELIETAAV